jgi:hypothetical protein
MVQVQNNLGGNMSRAQIRGISPLALMRVIQQANAHRPTGYGTPGGVIGDPAYIERLLNIAEESQEPTPWMDRQRV